MNFYAESEEDRSHELSDTYAAKVEIFVFKRNIFELSAFRVRYCYVKSDTDKSLVCFAN